MTARLKALVLFVTLFLPLAAFSMASRAAMSTSSAQPNVVLVITDDQGYGDLSAHGNPILRTPELDRLHGESTRLTDFHVSPTCAPTRGALMSGQWANRAGPWHTIMGRSMLFTDKTTLGEVFSDNGYATGLFGKWHLGDNYPYRPEDRGFQEVVRHGAGGIGQTPDYWDNGYFDDTYFHNGEPKQFEGFCTDVFFDEARRFMREQAEQGKPFFAYISTNAPHEPFLAPESFSEPYLETASIHEALPYFYGMIANIDENVGQLREWLEREGLAENTLFIFMTDNGTVLGQRNFNAGMRGNKGDEYEGGHRVPFFLHWPAGGFDQPRDIDRLTAHVDVLPTLIELCGLEPLPEAYTLDGRSLVPLLSDPKADWPDRVVITDSQRVVNPVKWKQSSTMNERWRLINGEELYDIEADPRQARDIAADYPEVKAELRAAYEAWWADLQPAFETSSRIHVGNPAENPSTLTAHDWITAGKFPPWNQSNIRRTRQTDARHWAITVETAGSYRIALRRWPRESGLSLRSAVEAGPTEPGLKTYRETPGVALPIVGATIHIAGQTLEMELPHDQAEAVFEIDLPAGDADLEATFTLETGGVEGAYYAYVEKLCMNSSTPIAFAVGCQSSLVQEFKDPPREYGPMPLWFLNGDMTSEGIRTQMEAAHKSGFTGVGPLATARKSPTRPGTTPRFLTPDYFDRFQDILDMAEELDMNVILYDDNDYPSGMAGGKLSALYPEHTMKRLDLVEDEFTGPGTFSQKIDAIRLMAAVAMHTETKERIEISEFVEEGVLKWEAPAGTWKIMLFPLVKDGWHTAYPVVDYLDPTAVRKKMELTYDRYAEAFGSYFGNIIQKTFFDDVGFWRFPRSWTGRFNEKFEELYGYDPKPFYPVLWYDIGPDTESLRNAFFNTRAEMLAESYPKLVAQWNERHGLQSTGHPPGNYDPTPIDMNGDIFKFYRYTQIPMADVILGYQFGQAGHKLISSAADYYDRPLVSTEIYGAFRKRDVHFDAAMLYRPLFETFARGINFVIPHAMWYNPENDIIEPLVSSGNEEIADELPAYSKLVARSCLLLQGGRRVSDIAVLYPFEELAGYYNFGKPDKVRQGFYVSPITDYQAISALLTNDLRRDFTFVHPEFFLEDKYAIKEGSVILQNAENYQEYKVMFLTGSHVASYKTLAKLKEFYDNGGTIISTTQLPSKSSERGADNKVNELIEGIFGQMPAAVDTSTIHRNANANGGLAVHIPNPTKEAIQAVLDERMNADVRFTPNPVLKTDWGKLNYIHKVRRGQHIYMFTNSSDETIETDVILRGDLKLEKWDPHTGMIEHNLASKQFVENEESFTRLKLILDPVNSVFFVSSNYPQARPSQ